MHNAISQTHTFLFTSGIAIMLCALLIRFLSETMMKELIMSAECVPTVKSILIMIFHALYGVVWFRLNHFFFANCENIDIPCHNNHCIKMWIISHCFRFSTLKCTFSKNGWKSIDVIKFLFRVSIFFPGPIHGNNSRVQFVWNYSEVTNVALWLFIS